MNGGGRTAVSERLSIDRSEWYFLFNFISLSGILVSVNNGRRCWWELGGLRSHIVDVECCIYLAFDGLCTTCTGIEFIDRNMDS